MRSFTCTALATAFPPTCRGQKLHDEGFAVLAIDYRGFGRAKADCPQKPAPRDADAAWAEQETPLQQVNAMIVYGTWAAPSASRRYASAQDAAGLVVESSFTSVREMQQYTAYKVDSP